jgi:ADP-ribose pyrophosphatase
MLKTNMTDNHFTHNDYEIISREVKYEGIFRTARYEVRHKLFDGSWSEGFVREMQERPSASCVLPYDPNLDLVVLIQQFRIGAIANPKSPWLLEIPAGCIEHGMTPAEVAIAEAQEEAGVTIEALQPVSEFYSSPGGCNERVHVFCGKVDASKVDGVHGIVKEHENIRAFAVPVEEAFALLRKGDINVAPGIVALQWLQVNRDWLRTLWQT